MNALTTRSDPDLHRCHRLLREWRRQGVSIREQSRRLRMAPKTVARLLAQLPADTPRDAGPHECDLLPEPNDPPPGFDPANLRRCRSCGALVYLWPCLACALDGAENPATSPGVPCHAHP